MPGGEALEATLPASEGPTPTGTIGRFQSLGLLGRGGMGVVLRAHDPQLDRPVALKIMAPGRWHDTVATLGEQRLEREAMAMARLSHPNVVTVYEMGKAGEAAYIAMELVEGGTLRAWMDAGGHGWREIIDVFLACGRGLAAAHGAGLVHRDFKPENVLIDHDGRPRVTDFGLVAVGLAVDGPALAAGSGDDVTMHGAAVGTPAYMAPEQWQGQDVDPRTDQFAFCVALWEALWGARPFTGATSAKVRDAVLAGTIARPATPARATAFPARAQRAIEAILRRGLAVDRTARWDDLSALLAALTRVTTWRGRGWRWAGAGVAALALAGAGWALTRPAVAAPCARADQAMREAWNPDILAAVTTALGPAPAALAAEELAHAAPRLDAYAARWRAGARAACEATHVHKQASPALLDQRAACLHRGVASVSALVTTLRAAGAASTSHLREAVAHLPDVAACEQVTRLSTITPLPSDPALQAEVQRIDTVLAGVDAARHAGITPDGRRRLDDAITAARAVGYAPVLARALLTRGNIEQDGTAYAAAEAAFREAASAAADGRDDALAAEAWLGVIGAVGERRDDFAAGVALEPVADAAVRRAGDDPTLRRMYLQTLGAFAARRGEFELARERMEAARALAGDDATARARIANDLAVLTVNSQGEAAAREPARAALDAARQAFGERHPSYASALQLQAHVLDALGESAQAEPMLRQAVAINEAAYGPRSAAVAELLLPVANAERNLGRFDQARVTYQRSITLGAELGMSPTVQSLPVMGLAQLEIELGNPAAALPHLDRAITLLGGVDGEVTTDKALAIYLRGQALRDSGRCAEARPTLEALLVRLEALPHLRPYVWVVAAQCQIAARSWDAARATLDQAQAACTKMECSADTLGQFTFLRGRMLVESGRDVARGRALAREGYQLTAPANEVEAKPMATWLATQPPAPR